MLLDAHARLQARCKAIEVEIAHVHNTLSRELENISARGNKEHEEAAGAHKQLMDISSGQSDLRTDFKALRDRVHALGASIPQVCLVMSGMVSSAAMNSLLSRAHLRGCCYLYLHTLAQSA
jgi:citrate lyase beta subunit